MAAAVALSPPVLSDGANSRWREEIVSRSAIMDELLRQASRVADDPGPLLIAGPAGAGKATLARAVHRASPRSKKAIVTLSCGALAEAELEKQLFGGGNALREAQGGTLFIDEVESLAGNSGPIVAARPWWNPADSADRAPACPMYG